MIAKIDLRASPSDANKIAKYNPPATHFFIGNAFLGSDAFTGSDAFPGSNAFARIQTTPVPAFSVMIDPHLGGLMIAPPA